MMQQNETGAPSVESGLCFGAADKKTDIISAFSPQSLYVYFPAKAMTWQIFPQSFMLSNTLILRSLRG
jgi:hypothetical protein